MGTEKVSSSIIWFADLVQHSYMRQLYSIQYERVMNIISPDQLQIVLNEGTCLFQGWKGIY